jgi:hypothetical protein
MGPVEELPDVSFYVLNEPALSAPEPDEVGIWQELARLRTENHAWRECVEGILLDVAHRSTSADALKAAIRRRIQTLGGRVAGIYHQ